MRSSCLLQLLEKDEIISDPQKVVNDMNNNFVNVAPKIQNGSRGAGQYFKRA